MNKFDRTLMSGGLPNFNIKESLPKKTTRNKKSKVENYGLVLEKFTKPAFMVRKFYIDDEFNALIASPLRSEKKLG